MVGTEICSFHCLKIRTSVITPLSTAEATSVLFRQNHQRGLGQTFSVLLFPEGQWKRLLTAVFLGVLSPLTSSGQLSIYTVSYLQSFQFKDPSGSYIKLSHDLKAQTQTHQGDAKI